MRSFVACLASATETPLEHLPLGRDTADLQIAAAYAVASLDPTVRPAAPAPQNGTVEAIAIAPAAGIGLDVLIADGSCCPDVEAPLRSWEPSLKLVSWRQQDPIAAAS